MATAEHKHPNYMAIFWYLAILTVVEIAVIYMPLAKFTIGVLLCSLALGKAVLVAMYFMHLRFETRALGLVLDGRGVRPLRPPLRAGAGLLRRGDLRQLRDDRGPHDRRLLPPLGPDGPLHGGATRAAAAGRDPVPAVVLPVQPEPLARP